MGCTCQTSASSHTMNIDFHVQTSTWTFEQHHAAEMRIGERIQLTAGPRPRGVVPVNHKAKDFSCRLREFWNVRLFYAFQCEARAKNIGFPSPDMECSCNSIPRIDCRWRKSASKQWQARRGFFPPSGSRLNERGEMFHVALLRRLLFLSIWNSLLAQQAGHSIRCFEPACFIVSLHFLFCLPVFPEAFVALISRGPSAL